MGGFAGAVIELRRLKGSKGWAKKGWNVTPARAVGTVSVIIGIDLNASSNSPVRVAPAKMSWQGYVHQNVLVPVGSLRRGAILASRSSGESAVVTVEAPACLLGIAVLSGNNLVPLLRKVGFPRVWRH